MIDMSLKFLFSVSPHPWSWPVGQGHGLKNFILIVCFFFFKISSFLNPSINLNYDLYDERRWSKILFSIISTPGHDLQVKVTNLSILY